jgi:hypothetical protein
VSGRAGERRGGGTAARPSAFGRSRMSAFGRSILAPFKTLESI